MKNRKKSKALFVALALLTGTLFCACLPPDDLFSVFAEDGSPDAAVAAVQTDASGGTERTEYGSLGEALANWTDGTRLILLADCVADATVSVPLKEEKIFDLCGHTVSLREEGNGSVFSVEGSLTVTSQEAGGAVKGGNAQSGGGIYIGIQGNVLLEGNVEISSNTAQSGGGIFCGGELILSGNTVVEGNFGIDGADDDISLTRNNYIKMRDFTGRAGVVVAMMEDKFAEGTGDGTFFSDDKNYSVEKRGNKQFLISAPLASVHAEYASDRTVFPTSDLEILKSGITLSGTNVNGAPFQGEIGAYTLSTPSGRLFVGENEITLTTQDGFSATFSVMVTKPSLLSVTASFTGKEPVYSDMPLSSLVAQIIVTGRYNDGISRAIYSTGEETMRACGEEYIDDYFTLSGDLTDRKGDKATIMVHCGGQTVSVLVEISRHYVDVTMFTPREVSILEGQTVPLGAYIFLPDWIDALGSNIVPEPKIDGNSFDFAALPAGIYSVEISFRLLNERDMQLSDGTVKTRLLVYAPKFEGRTGEIAYTVSCEGGISPEWNFTLTDATADTKVALSDGLQVEKAYMLTFFPGPGGASQRDFLVRIYLPEALSKTGFTLFCMGKDGAARQLSFEDGTEEEPGGAARRYVQFETDELLETCFIFASDNHVSLYVVLSICFGALCFVGAGVLVWYFIRKKKLKIGKRKRKN